VPGSEGGGLASGDERRDSSNPLGLAVESIDPAQRRALGDPEGGVIVVDVESDAAWRAGVRPGDVILAINNREVSDMDSFDSLLEDLPKDRSVALRVWRDGASSFIAYRPTPADDD
jgi:serine protease Do